MQIVKKIIIPQMSSHTTYEPSATTLGTPGIECRYGSLFFVRGPIIGPLTKNLQWAPKQHNI
jgi:hypothetical protein